MAVFTLTPTSPFRLDLTVWVLRRLPINQMDRWDGKTYRARPDAGRYARGGGSGARRFGAGTASSPSPLEAYGWE